MRTPGDDRELILGFLFGEGIIRSGADLKSLETIPNGEHPELENVVSITLTADAPGVDERWQRKFLSSSSCGVCGVSSIEAVQEQAPTLPDDDLVIDSQLLFGLDAKLRSGQAVFERTGGLHAAGLFTENGEPVVIREDVGRHNAVDKVVGYAFRHGLIPLSRNLLMVSGRTSFEIVQKALKARIPVIVSVSAPSSLARDLAQASNQTLIGFLRRGRLNVYTGRRRVRSLIGP
jgi:FdhD protein